MRYIADVKYEDGQYRFYDVDNNPLSSDTLLMDLLDGARELRDKKCTKNLRIILSEPNH